MKRKGKYFATCPYSLYPSPTPLNKTKQKFMWGERNYFLSGNILFPRSTVLLAYPNIIQKAAKGGAKQQQNWVELYDTV